MSGLPGPWMEEEGQGADFDDSDGWCLECGEPFHLDDCGGYNPPCPCGCGCCRDHCEERRERDDDDGWEEEE